MLGVARSPAVSSHFGRRVKGRVAVGAEGGVAVRALDAGSTHFAHTAHCRRRSCWDLTRAGDRGLQWPSGVRSLGGGLVERRVAAARLAEEQRAVRTFHSGRMRFAQRTQRGRAGLR